MSTNFLQTTAGVSTALNDRRLDGIIQRPGAAGIIQRSAAGGCTQPKRLLAERSRSHIFSLTPIAEKNFTVHGDKNDTCHS